MPHFLFNKRQLNAIIIAANDKRNNEIAIGGRLTSMFALSLKDIAKKTKEELRAIRSKFNLIIIIIKVALGKQVNYWKPNRISERSIIIKTPLFAH